MKDINSFSHTNDPSMAFDVVVKDTMSRWLMWNKASFTTEQQTY